ncbi:hypothetical protein QEN19_003962 [Hanseniaspora menglaensis]
MTIIVTSCREFQEKVLKMRDSVMLDADLLNRFYKHKVRFINLRYIEKGRQESRNNICLRFSDLLPNDKYVEIYMSVADFHSYAIDSSTPLSNGVVYEIWCQWKKNSSLESHILQVLYINTI